jgi:hypothetical protein
VRENKSGSTKADAIIRTRTFPLANKAAALAQPVLIPCCMLPPRRRDWLLSPSHQPKAGDQYRIAQRQCDPYQCEGYFIRAGILLCSRCPISAGLPSIHDGSAPALIVSRPAQRSLQARQVATRPSPPGGSDGFVAFTALPGSRAGLHLQQTSAFSRRTHNRDLSTTVFAGYIPSRYNHYQR